MRDESDTCPENFHITVDGEDFDVAYDVLQPGAYHCSWLKGPATDYGFWIRRSDHRSSTSKEHETAIRGFLAAVNPVTGYIEDDLSSDGE